MTTDHDIEAQPRHSARRRAVSGGWTRSPAAACCAAARLRLHLAGQTPISARAFTKLERICDEHLQGCYRIDIIDLFEHPELAAGEQILAIRMLVRKLPPPIRKIIGDLSNTERVLVGLDLRGAG